MGDRYEVFSEKTGRCGDPHCDGHTSSYILDSKTGHRYSSYPLPDRNTLRFLNWLAKEPESSCVWCSGKPHEVPTDGVLHCPSCCDLAYWEVKFGTKEAHKERYK